MSNIWDKLEDKPYQVKLGNSIKSKNVSYHSIHYNLKPPSIDHSKPGALHCNKEDDIYILEYANQQKEEIYQFIGNQKEANKELILLYDKATNTIILERLDSTFHVRRETFNKSRSKWAEISNSKAISNYSSEVDNEPDVEEFDDIPVPSKSKINRGSTKTTTKNKGKANTNNNNIKNNNINTNTNNNIIADTFEEESEEEFEDLNNPTEEELDNRNPLAAYERMRAESAKTKVNKPKTTAKQQKQQKYTNDNNDDDTMIKEFEEDLAEFDVAEEAEKEIEEFALENELEQELEKELEVSGDEGNKLTDNENDNENEIDEEMLEEINDTLELDSSEEDSEDMSPTNKRKIDQDSGAAKRNKPNIHDGPISLSAFAGNDEEDEESSESSSSDDD